MHLAKLNLLAQHHLELTPSDVSTRPGLEARDRCRRAPRLVEVRRLTDAGGEEGFWERRRRRLLDNELSDSLEPRREARLVRE